MRRSRLLGLALAFPVALLLAAPEADARDRQARARKSAPKSGHAERTVTRTGKDGVPRTSSQDTTWQRDRGKWSRDTVHTGPGGSTATIHSEVERGDGGYTRTTTHTGPRGTTTAEGRGAWDPETKTWTRETLVTHPDGTTSTTAVTTEVTPNP